MNYWLDLFTGTTWAEFRQAGANISGFRPAMWKAASQIQPGDIMLCYLTGVMRWVGALEVVGPSQDKRLIWKEDEFPVRLEVRPLVTLEPEHGVPMADLEGRVSFYDGPEHRGRYKGFVRKSLNPFIVKKDGDSILDMLAKAHAKPIARPVDPKKLARKLFFSAERRKGKSMVPMVVSVPESEEADDVLTHPPMLDNQEKARNTQHTEIQYNLLQLGLDMGFDLWVARNDRSKVWNGKMLGNFSRMVSELPTQFNEVTNRTIELIDVLWLKGNSIVAAFEVEATTSIYSGLLRMNDLLALQPNLEINLYLVAPNDRRDKVEQEILRPTFSLHDKPLAKSCGFIGFNTLLKKLDGIRTLGLETSLKPDFLQKMAEYFNNDEILKSPR